MIVSVEKDLLNVLQHQVIVYMTIIANLSQLPTIGPVLDIVSKMCMDGIPLEDAEKVVDEIMSHQNEFVASWKKTIQEIKDTQITPEITEEPLTNE